MNFFAYQAHARRQSRWLVVLFTLAVVAVIVAVDAVILGVIGFNAEEAAGIRPFSGEGLRHYSDWLIAGAVATAALILVASLFRTATLRHGGGQIALDLGGTPVDADASDPLHRRLRNVVEEIAIASGVPVPEVYVLEQESGINAFAAGYSPSDAAIAVTRGTLERLNRSELQGVIAHEFSHVLNGDMRLNIRLIGVLFGIMVLTLIGRRILEHTRYVGRSRDRAVAAILVIAFGVMVVGAVGQFFGRWIKSAVSRQREYLADASAVQFTRDPSGIGGALKKIAALHRGSILVADTEEIGHMLFGSGKRMLMFATHPPVEKRILRVDPNFQTEELKRLAAKMADADRERRERLQAERQVSEGAQAGAARRTPHDPGGLLGEIGRPGWERLLMAATLAAAIPLHLRRAARSAEWAPQLLFYTVLDRNTEVREQQLLAVAKSMGAEHESGVRALLDAGGLPGDEQRLPLLEMAFPALKRRPVEFVERVLATVKELVSADGRIDVFEYLLARVVSQHLWAARNPQSVRTSGNRPLSWCRESALRVLAVLARHGHAESAAAIAAFRAGLTELGFDEPAAMPEVGDWAATLDADLPRLDRLAPKAKERLVGALIATVMHDGAAVPAELELLRAVCDLIHVPLPLLAPGSRKSAA